jgi:ankyrin repeat protein
VRLLLEHGANIEARADFFRTPLHVAAWNGHHATIQQLLDYGADIEAKDGSGRTPLQLAVWNRHKDIVQLLVDRGADIIQSTLTRSHFVRS